MIKWIINLIDKLTGNEKRLVAVISGPFEFMREYSGSWEKGGRITYYLYEYKSGRRWVEIIRNTSHINLKCDDSRRMKIYQVIHAWEKNAYNSVVIPTFKMMDDLRQPRILENMTDANLNEL